MNIKIPLDLRSCQLVKSDGVKAVLSGDKRRKGRALRLAFDFAGAGYALIRVPLKVDGTNLKLGADYLFQFDISGKAPANNLEVKLLDESGDNVWWVNRPRFLFPQTWQPVINKKRHFSYAWGPNREALSAVAFLELTVTNSGGGKGEVSFADLSYQELEVASEKEEAPRLWASSGKKSLAGLALSDTHSSHAGETVAPVTSTAGGWQSNNREEQSLIVSFDQPRELSGLVLDWGERWAVNYQLEIKGAHKKNWRVLDTICGGAGGRQYFRLPDEDIQAVRLILRRSSAGQGYVLRALSFKGLDFAPTENALWQAIAAECPRGFYPRYFLQEQSFFTVVGVSGGKHEALINEEGMLELGRQTFSLEPFLLPDGEKECLTWAQASHEQGLEEGYLPIAWVKRRHEKAGLELEVKALAQGAQEHSTLYARYKITNQGAKPLSGKLVLALSPFQVNPPWQFLNTPGGFAAIKSIYNSGNLVCVNNQWRIVSLTEGMRFGAGCLASGSLAAHLQQGYILESQGVCDPRGYAWGALTYDYQLAPGESQDVELAVPYTAQSPLATWQWAREKARESWLAVLGQVGLALPAYPTLLNTVKSQLAYILINRDAQAIQPGSRCYRRTWIRDASLTCAALLQYGLWQEVRAFIEWFAPYQYSSGKIPCCVDSRGADPTPEHDSHGEFIFLVMEYYRYTKDRAFLRKFFPAMVRAAAYIEWLSYQTRRGEFEEGGAKAHLRGILPPSISHEGYSAHPAYSNWDNLFAIKGLSDVLAAAQVLAIEPEVQRLTAVRDDFARHLHAALTKSMALHGIDFIPGANDLGDFDPTSTTIGLDPCNLLSTLPVPLKRTFERYWQFFLARRAGAVDWQNYTPYEWRVVGTLVRLDEPEKAHEAMEYFLSHRRPEGWNHWAEVVWKDALTPGFIGDAPHGWVGSDFLRSVRNLFVYEEGGALMVGRGLKSDWFKLGLEMINLPTHFGQISLSVREEEGLVTYVVSGDVVAPVVLFVVAGTISVNGEVAEKKSGPLFLTQLPALVEVRQ